MKGRVNTQYGKGIIIKPEGNEGLLSERFLVKLDSTELLSESLRDYHDKEGGIYFIKQELTQQRERRKMNQDKTPLMVLEEWINQHLLLSIGSKTVTFNIEQLNEKIQSLKGMEEEVITKSYVDGIEKGIRKGIELTKNK